MRDKNRLCRIGWEPRLPGSECSLETVADAGCCSYSWWRVRSSFSRAWQMFWWRRRLSPSMCEYNLLNCWSQPHERVSELSPQVTICCSINGNTPGFSLQTHLFDQSKCNKLPHSWFLAAHHFSQKQCRSLSQQPFWLGIARLTNDTWFFFF